MFAQFTKDKNKTKKSKKKKKIKKNESKKRTFKEMVKNMQEMLLVGSGIVTNVFKPTDTQIMVVMSDRYKEDIRAVVDFFEKE